MPSDGAVRSLRVLLSLLDQQSIDVDELTVHTPDLDDVFLALTGRTTEPTEPTEPTDVTPDAETAEVAR